MPCAVATLSVEPHGLVSACCLRTWWAVDETQRTFTHHSTLMTPPHAKLPKTQGPRLPRPWMMRVKKLEETRSGKATNDIKRHKRKQKDQKAHRLCAIWRLHMDTHGTLVTVGPCILKIHHQHVKIGCWSNASLALTWHSAPHKCAKFRSSRYSTPPRVLEQRWTKQLSETSLPGMASLTVNLNEMTKPRRHKSVGSVRNCCNHSQRRCIPTLHKKRSRSGRDAGSLLIFQSQSNSAIVHNRPKENRVVAAHVVFTCIYRINIRTGCDTPVPVM